MQRPRGWAPDSLGQHPRVGSATTLMCVLLGIFFHGLIAWPSYRWIDYFEAIDDCEWYTESVVSWGDQNIVRHGKGYEDSLTTQYFPSEIAEPIAEHCPPFSFLSRASKVSNPSVPASVSRTGRTVVRPVKRHDQYSVLWPHVLGDSKSYHDKPVILRRAPSYC